MQRLKNKEIALVRQAILIEQQGLCALCLEQIEENKAVLDHCHKTGQIRGVLHRGCNALEGVIENALPRNLITLQRLQNILARLIWYQTQLKPQLHPSHKTADEKKQRAKARRKNK
jgi:hypothetical protein